MRLEWETELQPSKYADDDNLVWRVEHHLKKVWDKDPLAQFANPLHGQWKVSVAYVTKVSDRKWLCNFTLTNNESRTFRSLKAAKAYTVAIITLEN